MDIITKDNRYFIQIDELDGLHKNLGLSNSFIRSVQIANRSVKIKNGLDIDKNYLVIDRVTDNDATFINLFGICVDTKTFNIAFGLNVESDDYILVGNVGKLLCNVLEIKRLPDWFDVKCLLGLLKYDTVNTIYNFDKILVEMYKCNFNCDVDTSNSIVYEIVKQKESEKDTFINDPLIHKVMYSNTLYLYKFINKCLVIHQTFTRQAMFFFNNFILESSYDEMYSNYLMLFSSGEFSIKNLYQYSDSNVEMLYLYYLSKGIPCVYLNALMSYALFLRQRVIMFKNLKRSNVLSNMDSIVRCALKIQSSCYSSNDKSQIFVYNCIQLLKYKDKYDIFVFAIDSNNTYLVEYILSGLGILDMLSDNNISVVEFCKYTLDYDKNVQCLVDGMSLYRKPIIDGQSNFVHVSVSRIYNVCKTFNTFSKSLLNLFNRD